MITPQEAKKMLKAKLECLKNETSGINYDCNMHLCDGCSLNYEQGNMGEQKEALQMAIKALEQQSHNAKFVPSRDGYDGHVTCSNCFKIYDWDSEAQYFNYCPKCGADMRESEE